MKVVIFANGDFTWNHYTSQALKQASLVIAADNGAQHCFSRGILPDVVIGDFDSLPFKILQELIAADTEVIRHPPHKDRTDLELALDYALAHGATHVTLCGALGRRWDMSLSNIFLLSHPKYHPFTLIMVNHNHLFHIITPTSPLIFSGKKGDTISLLPLTATVEGIETHNLRYPLQREDLYAASTRGLSNELMEEHFTIFITAGVLLCICIPHENAL